MKTSTIPMAAVSVVPLVVLLLLGVGRGDPAPMGRYSIDVPKVGIVTDNVTKLQWQRVIGPATSHFAAQSCTDATQALGGNWRLPQVNELSTIFGDSNTYDDNAFPIPRECFWASEVDVTSKVDKKYWYVESKGGNQGVGTGTLSDAHSICRVRCVR
jgi:Protein of unknown function (DUF1566)